MQRPVVSAVMPNYNDAGTIRDALEALLSQSFRRLEVIVVDDGSTDNSLEVIGEVARKDPRVQVLRHERNNGPIFAQLPGFQRASGDYVCSTSANDKVLPGFIEKLVSCLESNPEAGVAFCDVLCMDDPDYSQIAGFAKEPVHLTPDAMVKILRKRRVFMLGGGMTLVRRSALRDAGWLMPDLRWMADFFALQVVGFRHGVCHVPEPLYAIRKPSYSNTGPRSHAQREAILYMLRLLRSPEYRDVLPSFHQSGILAAVPGLLSAVLRHPEHWDFLAPILLRRALWNETKNALRPITPVALRQTYRRIRDRYYAGTSLRY